MIPPPVDASGSHRGSFVRGLAGGALLGAAAGLLAAPWIHEALRTARRRLTVATAGAREAVVDDLRKKGRDVYGKALNVVVRSAEDVRERATQAQGELNQHATAGAPTRTSS
ncbi:MAG: hypothetical protein A3F70_02355 [Acidobacteria bacterium RIFCSPLOWO2_12_FULL_67_14]|nr:MAG: hypothetical protein A3F70_02355 [Acidobacteria bacterium RIFCSPLOWO2_12_FULL_67_14]